MNFMAKLKLGFLSIGSSSQTRPFAHWHSLLPSFISLNLVYFSYAFFQPFYSLIYNSFTHTPPLAKKHSAIYIYFLINLSKKKIFFLIYLIKKCILLHMVDLILRAKFWNILGT